MHFLTIFNYFQTMICILYIRNLCICYNYYFKYDYEKLLIIASLVR